MLQTFSLLEVYEFRGIARVRVIKRQSHGTWLPDSNILGSVQYKVDQRHVTIRRAFQPNIRDWSTDSQVCLTASLLSRLTIAFLSPSPEHLKLVGYHNIKLA